MRAQRLTGLVAATAALVGAPVIAQAATSHAELFNNASGTITCGVGSVSSTTTPEFLCSAGSKGYAELGPTGKAKLVQVKQHEPFIGTPPGARLQPGSKWQKSPISCTIAKTTVTCKNASGHGFTVSATGYSTF